MDLNIEKVENLIGEGNSEGALSLVKEYLLSDLTKKQRGEAYVMFASVFMKANNEVMEKYKQILDEANDVASQINESEDKFKIDQIKGSF